MKVNRVILSSNNNELYYPFWNVLSPVYKEKFGIQPTLVWVGTYPELEECKIDTSLGDVVVVNPDPDYHIPWQTTWALFWATQLFLEDTCLIIGIDQIPLSQLFLKMVEGFSEDSYNMLIADAYSPNHWSKTGGASPSSYHIAKGSTFCDVYQFDKDFKSEIEKVGKSGISGLWENTEGRWGIDESYSCYKLREWTGKINSLDQFRFLEQRRIECCRNQEPVYDINKLKSGWYSESHLCRPYTNHKEYIDTLINNIPNYI